MTPEVVIAKAHYQAESSSHEASAVYYPESDGEYYVC
jgi:hypothetical protein